MEKPKTYCSFVATLEKENPHKIYHDTQYGFPIESDNELFCRLVLEINQAGLSWTTILNKQENFRKAFANFKVKTVANYGELEIARLLSDVGIIRNKLKVNAAIHNANKILELQQTHGSFKNWLDSNHPLEREQWVKLFKKIFKFTGGEITNEFLLSCGYLKGAHDHDCELFETVKKHKPMWSLEI